MNAERALAPNTAAQTLHQFGERLWVIGLFLVPLLADFLAQAPYFGLQTRLYPAVVFVAFLVALFLLLVLFVTPSLKFLETLGGAWARRVLMLVCVASTLLTLPFLGGTPSLAIRGVLGIFLIAALVLFVRNPKTLLWFFLLALAYSFLQRARFLNAVALNPEFADMLPVIIAGGNNFLAGNAPYVIYKMPWDLPLVYFPMTWLLYLPALVLNFDLRFINLAAQVGIVLIFLSLVWRAREIPAVNFALGYAAFLLVLPTAMFWDAFTAHQIWWFWLLLAVRVLIARNFFWWAIVMGITLATSQLAVTVIPIFALYVLRAVGWKRALLHFAVLVGTTLLLLAPFVFQNPANFVKYTMLYYSDLAIYAQPWWERSRRWLYILGFGAEAWQRGWQDNLKFVQGALLVGFAALYTFRYQNMVVNALRVAIASLGFFLLFSAVVWQYYYQAVFYLLLFLVALLAIGARQEAHEDIGRGETRRNAER